MTTPAELYVWAERILEGLGDQTTSTGQVVTWLQYSLPKLNAAISTNFYLSSGSIYPQMYANESGIYEEIYYCDYLRKRASQLLGGTSFQDVVAFDGEEQGSVKFASFSERAKTYRLLAKDCAEAVKGLIGWYTEASGAAYAYQVLYNLRDAPNTYGLKQSPPSSCYHPYNSVFTRMTPY